MKETIKLIFYYYISETPEVKRLGKEDTQSRFNKTKIACRLTKDVYNKKSISVYAKLRHYATVIRQEIVYVVECVTLNKKVMMEELEIIDRRILSKILGPIKDGSLYIRRYNSERYTHIEKITDIIRKRIAFYGHQLRMNLNRLTEIETH